ncbi:MAG: DUF2127 domain-containing protein [Amaricoccus sp.]|uniref:DUF2127 domain-containing protein n=1 Tax=Amaricoccus sp. TaxID=1872485 RepID=UPI0039E4B503
MDQEAHERFERLAHETFEGAILLKGAFALLEASAGLLLWLIGPTPILRLIARINAVRPGDHTDWLATTLLHAAQSFSVQAEKFFAVYLFAHGMVKLSLVLGLFRRKRWAYPTSIVVMSMFVAYQMWRFSLTFGLGLLALSIFDSILVALIWREWRRLPPRHTT